MFKKKKDFSDRDPYLPHWNSWLITINSNSTNRGFIHPLRVILDYIKHNMGLFITSVLPNAQLLESRTIGNVEIGSSHHMVHIHGQIAIKTTGLAMLSYTGIKAFVDKQLSAIPGFVGSHFRADLVSNFNASMAIFEYINKEGELEAEENLDFKII